MIKIPTERFTLLIKVHLRLRCMNISTTVDNNITF